MKVKFGKHLDIILKEMCKRVRAPFSAISKTDTFWYSRYSWSEKKENNFRDWLIDYLYHTPEARKELIKFPRLYSGKKKLKQVANEFIFLYGWDYKK